jgi:pseudouridine-5'-phosphate glycosidase
MRRLLVAQAQLSGATAPPALDIAFSDEVRRQLARPNGARSVVALESTIISHGMPYPQNVECARELERIVRSHGAVPATIAVIAGRVHVGLSDSELEFFGKNGARCLKCSRRDLPFVIAEKRDGATTVSGTILIAHMVGIEIMATGGIGGVHRGGEVSMDVSADLTELGRTPVTVFCAGVKSILDIARTLEVLETQGVAVLGFQTQTFPAFFTRDSGCKAPLSVTDVDAVARFVLAQRALRTTSGAVVGIPLPAAAEADAAVVEAAIQQALKELAEQHVGGRDVTPFVLKRVNELTRGKSLVANLALVKHNTSIAAQVAARYAAM